jgi:hypothetical protein
MQLIMPLQLCAKGANVFHPMQGTLSDVLGLPTMENNGNEDEGEVGGKFDDFEWPPSDEETSHINFGSINTLLPQLSSHALSPCLSSHARSICHPQIKKFCTRSIWISFFLH